MFFNRINKAKLDKWYNDALEDLAKENKKLTDIHYEIKDGYFYIMDDSPLTEFRGLHVQTSCWGCYDNWGPYEMSTIVESIGILANLKKYQNMYNFMLDIFKKMKTRKETRVEIEKTSYVRDAGFTVCMNDSAYDFNVRLQPVDVEPYMKLCVDHMHDKGESDFPFDIDEYRAMVIEKFANSADKTVNALLPSIRGPLVDEWYDDDVRKKRNKQHIESLNSTCQNVIDEINKKIAETHQVVAVVN